MSSHIARVSLRYRPGADVLSGQIDLRELRADHTVTESPDADSTMIWSSASDSESVQYPSSFQFVHAAARLDQDSLPLPAGLASTVRTLVETAHEAVSHVDSPLAKVRARAEASTELALDELRRSEWPERPPGRRRVEPQQVADISRSLTRLAGAVQQRVPIDNEHEAIHTEQLSRILYELSSTISNGKGGTAPGTSAATRAAINEDTPLTISEQRVLEQALDDLDDPLSWHRVSRVLDRLSKELEHAAHWK